MKHTKFKLAAATTVLMGAAAVVTGCATGPRSTDPPPTDPRNNCHATTPPTTAQTTAKTTATTTIT